MKLGEVVVPMCTTISPSFIKMGRKLIARLVKGQVNLTYKSFSTGPQSIKSLKGCVIFDTFKTSKKQFDSLIWPQVLGYKVWSSRRHSQTMCAPEPKPPTYSISTYHTTEYHILSKTTADKLTKKYYCWGCKSKIQFSSWE